MIQPEDVQAVHGHRSESLVDFNNVDVIFGEGVFGEEFGDGDGRADAHDSGGTPATVAPTNFAMMGWPSAMALERFIRRIAAAPSVT